MPVPEVRHWIEERGECQYCGGDGRCYPCAGKGHEDVPGGGGEECEDCHGSGACAHCVDGREYWLFFTQGTGKRGSCLKRAEVERFQSDGTLPDWWQSYHGVTNTPPADVLLSEDT